MRALTRCVAPAVAVALLAALLAAPAPAVNDPPPGPFSPALVVGLRNPLAGTQFPVNGGGATADARVRLWVGKRRSATVTRRIGGRPALSGRLSNRKTGTGISGATLVVAGSLAATPNAWVVVGVTRTDRRGYFRAVQAPGPSRRFVVLYYPDAASVSPIASRRVLVRAGTRVFMVADALGRRLVLFEGRVSGAPVPPDGLLVYIQLRNPSGWAGLRLVKTDAKGRFLARRRILQRGRLLEVRAVVLEQNGWPLYGGTSKPLRVRVR